MNKKNLLHLMVTTMVAILSVGFSSCGSDDNDESNANSSYNLSYRGEVQTKYLDWADAMSPFLRLEFGEGIPNGTEWFLECDASWIKLRNTHGKVNSAHVEAIPFTIEDNTNYNDREAYIYLEVPGGNPLSTNYTTVTIHQYGYETHLSMGRSLSFRTNLSKAESTTLTVEKLAVYQLMDIDWGDGRKDILTKNDFYSTSNLSISHQYKSFGSYDVTLRFAPEHKRTAFSFFLAKGQGIEEFNYYDGRPISEGIDNSKRILVSYSDDNGFRVTQY